MKRVIIFTLFLLLAVFAFADTYTIGDGTSTQSYIPFYGFYNYNWSKVIFTQAEINTAGLTVANNIIGVGFYVGNSPSNYSMQDQRVYVRHTTASAYETTDTNYPDNTQFQLVFQGELTYNGGGWHHITFTAPFVWDGSQNIEFLFENWDGSYVSNYPNFQYTSTTPDYKAVYKQLDANFPTDNGTRTYNRPNIQLITPFTTQPDPAVAISPLPGATMVSLYATLNWRSGNIWSDGYRLSFGTNNPPTNLVNNQDLGPATTYDPVPDLLPNTTYYWQVVPYNSLGNAINCPVWSFTTHGDPGVTTLPYSQNWDAVTPPELPFDWTNIIQSTSTSAVVATYASTTYAHSQPNCARLYNPSDENATLILVGPPIMAPLSVNTIRLRFWARSSGSNYPLSIGVMSNSQDPDTYIEVQNLALTSTLTEYVVNLTSYTGTGTHICFKHGLGGTARSLYVDDVVFEPIAPNDLACIALTGNSTPTVGTASAYVAAVHNNGTASQSAYTVKLYDGNNTELVSVAGQTIAPDATEMVTLTWTPAVEGPATLYAKVILAGDVNPANDQSPNLNISVQPAGSTVVTIGEGNLAEGVPLEFFYKHSLHQALYYQNELNMFGNITALTFYNNFVSDLTDKPCQFWLGQTDLADLSAGWILPADGLTLVFDGTVNFPTGENLITIPLQTPFSYTHGNLVLYACRPMDTSYFSSSDNFQAQTVGSNRARKLQSDSTTYDPQNPSSAGTLSGTFAKTSFHITPPSPDPLFIVSPSSHDFGTVLMNTSQNQTFSIANSGGGTLTINSISISGNPFFTLQNLPTLPANLVIGQNITFVVNYNPTTAGTHTATITITDNRGNRLSHTVEITGTCHDPSISTLPYSQDFDAVTAPTLPIDWASIIQSTSTSAVVATYASTTYAHSQPNCVRLYNPSDSDATLILVGPPIIAPLSVNTVRLKFWARSSGADYPLSIGVMSNPQDPTTYTEVHNLALTTTLTEYVVNFTSYTGTGSHICFKHGLGGTGRSLYVDDVVFEQIAPNDLACEQLSGNTTPGVGNATTYNATIRNWGTASQSTYTVKLYNGDNVELATANGVDIAPDTSVEVPLTWTPSAEGIVVLYAKVFLAGDVNPANDQSPNINVHVMESGTNMVSIGDATTTNTATGVPTPYGTYFKNFHQQYLYTAAEILAAGGAPGPITSLGFNVMAVNTCSPMPNYTINLKHTTQEALTTTFETGDYTQVFYQNDFLPVDGWNTHTFSAPFIWNGTSNLLVDITTTMIPGTYTRNAQVYYTATTGVNTSLRYQSDTTDASSSTTGTTSVNRANIRLSFNFQGMGTINGVVTSGGNPLADVNIVLQGTVFSCVTDVNGAYNFPYVQPGTYTITASKIGYDTQSVTVTLSADQTITQNFNLIPSASVNVTGFVVGSDQPTVGLADVEITLLGPINYSGTTNASGNFTITGVLTGNTYNYRLETEGYQDLTGSITIGTSNYDMGTLVMSELAFPPRQVQAIENTAQTQVSLAWMAPGTSGGAGIEDFEFDDGGWVPSSNWSNPLGDWQWTNTYDISNYTDIDTYVDAPPAEAYSGTGLWGTVINGGYTNANGWSYLRKTFDLSGLTNPVLDLWHYMDGYNTWDYGLIKVNGTTLWGSSSAAVFMPWQRLTIDLSAFGNQNNVEISFEWFATGTVSYAGWYIDDVYVGLPMGRAITKIAPPTPIPPGRFAGLESDGVASKQQLINSIRSKNQVSIDSNLESNRLFTGYKVWRLLQGSEGDETSWTQLTTNSITDTSYVDNAWGGLPDGNYKWAVKAFYTNDVPSVPAFSNMLRILRQDLAATLISGPATTSVGVATTYQVTVENTSSTTQLGTNYTVKLMSGTTELASVNGVNLTAGQTHVFDVVWTPTTDGTMSINGKVVLNGDTVPTNDSTPTILVMVHPAGTVTYTVGDGSQTFRTPIDFYWKNSVHQYLIYPAEIDNFMGILTGICLYNNFTQDLLDKPINVWLGTTTAEDMTAGWIPIQNHTQVFSGNLNFPIGENVITIPFANPYLYLNGENLILTFQRPMDNNYYNSTNYFKAQTVGSNRARKIQSDSVNYDPANMTADGTLTGQFPMTTLFGVPGGVGHLNGTVTGAGGMPLEGAAVAFATGGYNAVTNAQGQYLIHNILPNTYTVNFSAYGHIDATRTVTIAEDVTETLNVSMTPMPTVSVTGQVNASDTGAGISGASIHLQGYANYDANSTASGSFTIPGVYANQTYDYVIMAPGYTSAQGTINVASANLNMGTIVLNEVAYAPHTVVAEENSTGSTVELTWQPPDPNAVEITESFEGNAFPPTDWTQTVNNTGEPTSNGVYPTWCRFGPITISGQQANPTDGAYQSGLWWSYNHQDEWLITPAFNCPPSGYLNFDSYVFLGSTNADHYYVKISLDNGTTWTEIWDASAQTGGWNYYASPINIDLGAYSGQQVKLAFNATDGPDDSGLWYVWFIDNIYIGNALTAAATPAQTIRFSDSDLIVKSAGTNGFGARPMTNVNPSRALQNGGVRNEPRLPFPDEIRGVAQSGRLHVGYKVWRLTQGNENNEASWQSLTPQVITETDLSDTTWISLPNGNYRWAVKAIYTNGVSSVPSFSNIIEKFQYTGLIAGVVRSSSNTPIAGAHVTANGITATTNNGGAYTLMLPVGTYDVTASATGYFTQTAQGIQVNANQTTTLNFVMALPNEDVVQVSATALIGNYPNPFNPETTISYSVKEPAPVKIEIFNTKGQLVRTLVNQIQPSGFYSEIWNGTDERGNPVASGVYMYRMTAGNYSSHRKMMLIK